MTEAHTVGGVKFEYFPGDTKDPCRAKMRNHFGMGVTFTAAMDNMIAAIEAELKTAKAARVSLKELA